MRARRRGCCISTERGRRQPAAASRDFPWHPGKAPTSGAAGGLKVVTTQLSPGYLRKNGVPYSQNAAVTEYFDRHTDFGSEWFTVTTVVEDPQYLAQPFITSTHFKKEPDGAKFTPMGCHTDPPRTDKPLVN